METYTIKQDTKLPNYGKWYIEGTNGHSVFYLTVSGSTWYDYPNSYFETAESAANSLVKNFSITDRFKVGYSGWGNERYIHYESLKQYLWKDGSRQNSVELVFGVSRNGLFNDDLEVLEALSKRHSFTLNVVPVSEPKKETENTICYVFRQNQRSVSVNYKKWEVEKRKQGQDWDYLYFNGDWGLGGYFGTYEEAEKCLLETLCKDLKVSFVNVSSVKGYYVYDIRPNTRNIFLWKNGELHGQTFYDKKDGWFKSKTEILFALAKYGKFEIKFEGCDNSTKETDKIDRIIEQAKVEWKNAFTANNNGSCFSWGNKNYILANTYAQVLQLLADEGNKKAAKVIEEMVKLIR
jgi:hypothetical protein